MARLLSWCSFAKDKTATHTGVGVEIGVGISYIYRAGMGSQKRQVRIAPLAAAVLFYINSPLMPARDVKITVIDVELEIPLEAATVRTPDGRDWVCDDNGVVVVELPDESVAVVQAAYPGYETGRAVVRLNVTEMMMGLLLGGMLEGRELVVEAPRPRASETKPGRSVAISGQELARTAEIGAIEDIMSSIKLLPGVGYAGMFNSMPSVRGGSPGDLMAVFDGFYVENPYHFGGGVSIFDPRMIESAQLSHGIFSARYGHTISGILDITSKKGDTALSTIELGISSSAANLNISRPIDENGAVMAMFKATYWAPFIWLAQLASRFIENEQLAAVKSVSTAPYILSGTVSANYRFTPSLFSTVNGFIGADGGGGHYENDYNADGYGGFANMSAVWINSLGFLTTSVIWTPLSSMSLGLKMGAGFNRTELDADIENQLTVPYTDEFRDHFSSYLNDRTHFVVDDNTKLYNDNKTENLQARLDYDWDVGGGFMLAAGAQELYSRWLRTEEMQGRFEGRAPPIDGRPNLIADRQLYVNQPYSMSVDAENHAFTTSGYLISEWRSPGRLFEVEAGIRVDALTFFGKDFSVKSEPAYNPRLNIDINILKDRGGGGIDSLTLTLGSGLFSSMTNDIAELQKGSVEDFELKPNRSWTSLAGVNINFLDSWTLNIEAYYKYVFSRYYRINLVNSLQTSANQTYFFDGSGQVIGADLMLHKRAGPYIDGWLAYTFTYARYKDPGFAQTTGQNQYRADPYYPAFHRFHNLNLILNIKPQNKFHIYVRYGLASGQPKPEPGSIDYYPVSILEKDASGNLTAKDGGYYIQKYKRDSYYSDDSRTTFSMPFDVKFSWFFFNKKGRTTGEFYVAVENIASLFYRSQANTSFNQYTGKEDTGSTAAVYELPIPIPSVGIKWSY